MKYLIALISLLALSGCYSTHELQSAYIQHNKCFAKHHPFRVHRVPRDGYTLYAREFNPELKGKAPTILLMHGFPDSGHLYDALIPYLGHNRVITFDFLGWGDSDKPKDHRYTSKSLYRDIEAIDRYFKLDNVIVVVHDASGPPGIDWAVAHPSKVNTLVLLNTFYSPMKALKAPDAIARFSTPGFYRDMSVFFTKHFDTFWIDGYSTQVKHFITNEARKEHYTKVLTYGSMGIRPAFYDLNSVLIEETHARARNLPKLKAFAKPVKIIFGAKDKALNVGVAKAFAEIFPNDTLTLVKEGGHYVQIDAPKAVAEAMLK